ncbi:MULTISPECIES: ATP-grasp domain-containing protein [unclassified Kitasatospora]|uniref:ATP-binding protein n=1 Tax=unclassified Kitasatospora TaxID=2633591 RepID=UPI0024758C5F|nr:ATP-grasp domain-containing protein [Kitasatospora sp. MAP12-44]
MTNTGNTTYATQLAARADLRVLFVTEPRFVDQYPPGTELALVDDLNDPVAATAAVVAQLPLKEFSHVLALSERAAQTAGHLRSHLGLPGPSFDTVVNCTDKHLMKQRFQDAGLPCARLAVAHTPDEVAAAAREIGYPVIVKPVLGAGVDATEVIRSDEEMASPPVKAYLDRLARPATTSEKGFPVLVEQFLDVAHEYHCDGSVVEGRVAYVRVSRYLRPVLDYSSGVFGSYLLDQDSAEAAEIRAMHERAVHAVGLRDGVTHFEVLGTEQGLFAGEIACRPGGGGIRRLLQLDSGFDSWAAYIASSLGEAYEIPAHAPEDVSGQLVHVLLPARRGTVASISTAADFAAVPGLIEVDMRLKEGDVVGGLMDSSTVSGLVFARTAAQGPLDIGRAIESAFRLETLPPAAAESHTAAPEEKTP